MGLYQHKLIWKHYGCCITPSILHCVIAAVICAVAMKCNSSADLESLKTASSSKGYSYNIISFLLTVQNFI